MSETIATFQAKTVDITLEDGAILKFEGLSLGLLADAEDTYGDQQSFIDCLGFKKGTREALNALWMLVANKADFPGGSAEFGKRLTLSELPKLKEAAGALIRISMPAEGKPAAGKSGKKGKGQQSHQTGATSSAPSPGSTA